MEYKTFDLTYRPEGNVFPGAYIFIERGKLCDEVKAAFGRENQKLCLKVFREPLIGKIEDYEWGSPFSKDEHRSTLIDATKAQNVASWYSLAPRVYAIVIINYRGRQYPAQLTDFQDGVIMQASENKEAIFLKIREVFNEFGFEEPVCDFIPNNVIAGKWVDWQGARPKKDYLEKLVEKVKKTAYFVEATHYQAQPDIGLDGFRDSKQRIKDLKLDETDFTDKSVLDVGCCGGFFCNYSAGRGAKRVVGVDVARNAQIARELSNWLGYFNVDYIAKTIKKDETIEDFAGIKEFNVVLYLAVNWYLGFPDWCFKMTSDTMIVEKNGKEDEITDAEVEKTLNDHFREVKKIGVRSDFDKQPIFRCQK